jgi:hypothetical protein
MSREEKWFVGHSRPHVLGATSWYGPWRTKREAEQEKPRVEEYWFSRAGINGPHGYTFIERDDTEDIAYGALSIERHKARPCKGLVGE